MTAQLFRWNQARRRIAGYPKAAAGGLVLLAVCGSLFFPGMRKLVCLPVERLAAVFRHDTWMEGELPPARGCILDREGRPLAWSTRHFSLYWRVPERTDLAREELSVLRGYVARIGLSEAELGGSGGHQVMLRDNLSGREVQALSRLRRDLPGMEVRSYTVRHRVTSPVLASLIGDVEVVDGLERGISGAERVNDDRLRGRPGHFRVKVDKDRHWLAESWQKTAEVRPGYDVQLSVTLDGPPATASH